jgi:hypothetical protein
MEVAYCQLCSHIQIDLTKTGICLAFWFDHLHSQFQHQFELLIDY